MLEAEYVLARLDMEHRAEWHVRANILVSGLLENLIILQVRRNHLRIAHQREATRVQRHRCHHGDQLAPTQPKPVSVTVSVARCLSERSVSELRMFSFECTERAYVLHIFLTLTLSLRHSRIFGANLCNFKRRILILCRALGSIES